MQLAWQKVTLKFSASAKKVKNRPNFEKTSNLKVDALPHSSTDSTHIYRFYPPTIPLSIAGNKKNFACNTPCKKVTLKFCTPAKKAKNRPKIEKNSNLKVDALPHTSTNSAHIYNVYYPTNPLSIAGNKKNFACNTPSKKVTLKFSTLAKKAKIRLKIEEHSNVKVNALPHSSTDSTHIYHEYYLSVALSIEGIKNYFA